MDKGPNKPILSLIGVQRTYRQGHRAIHVLKDASVDLHAGEAAALVGPSGAGKSTLLQIAGLLEPPDGGKILLAGRDTATISELERTRIRRTDIGFIYQFHHLLPEFSALENVVLPQLVAGHSRKDANERSRQLLESLGLADRADHRPSELSGGEQQRVAIARSVANGPRLLLADEPTGNLDPETAERVFGQLLSLVRGAGLAAIIATHNVELARQMDRVLRLEGGALVEDRTVLTE